MIRGPGRLWYFVFATGFTLIQIHINMYGSTVCEQRLIIIVRGSVDILSHTESMESRLCLNWLPASFRRVGRSRSVIGNCVLALEHILFHGYLVFAHVKHPTDDSVEQHDTQVHDKHEDTGEDGSVPRDDGGRGTDVVSRTSFSHIPGSCHRQDCRTQPRHQQG